MLENQVNISFPQKCFRWRVIFNIVQDFIATNIDIDNQQIKIQILDTFGTESFNSIANNYYKDIFGAIIIYDIFDINSFNTIKYLIEYIKLNTLPNIRKILIRNKFDNSKGKVTE